MSGPRSLRGLAHLRGVQAKVERNMEPDAVEEAAWEHKLDVVSQWLEAQVLGYMRRRRATRQEGVRE